MEKIIRHKAVVSKYASYPEDEDTCLAEVPVHTYGHVALLSTFGSDQVITEAAATSYGKAKKRKTIIERRNLVRFLYRSRHTSPFEMGEVLFYLRLPIFVVRQLIRHRTANVNEFSARYAELSDDFYIPSVGSIARQSTSNKQGRGEQMPLSEAEEIQQLMYDAQETSVRAYRKLLEAGVAREIARVPTAVGMYSEMYWKCDLHNFLGVLKLRDDPHAQEEIRDFAHAMYECAKPFFPMSFDAWEDYSKNARTFSALDLTFIGKVLASQGRAGWPEKPAEMSDREYRELTFLLDTLITSSKS